MLMSSNVPQQACKQQMDSNWVCWQHALGEGSKVKDGMRCLGMVRLRGMDPTAGAEGDSRRSCQPGSDSELLRTHIFEYCHSPNMSWLACLAGSHGAGPWGLASREGRSTP